MRIVFINQFFWPDAAATSQFLTDVVRSLAAEGHEVEVLCGQSSYAASNDGEKAPAATIRRTACAPFTRGLPARMFSYLSFLAGATWMGLRTRRADVVVTLTTPPMLPILGTVLKKFRHRRHFIWEMDLFPEALVDVGLMRANSSAVKLLSAISNWAHRSADGVIVLGECMRRRLVDRGVAASKIHVAELWADSAEIYPLPRARLEPFTVLYSGNLGLSHDIDTICGAMARLRDDGRFQFRFTGDGARRKDVKAFCDRHSILNASFGPYCPREQIVQSLSNCDVGLVTQRPQCLGTVVPSKIYGLMAAGRPILYIGPKESTPAEIIRRFRCGWQLDCGDDAGLAALLVDLESDPQQVRAAGTRARAALVEGYDLPHGLARFCRIIGAPVSVPDRNSAPVG